MGTQTEDVGLEFQVEEYTDGLFYVPSDPPLAPVKPLRVLVITAAERLIEELGWVLPRRSFSAEIATNAHQAYASAKGSCPAIVVIDARDFAPIAMGELMWALDAFGYTAVRVVWGADTAIGKTIAEQLRARKIGYVPVATTEGADTVANLIASRATMH